MQDFSSYDLDGYKEIFAAYVREKGLGYESDPNISDDVPWRPHVVGRGTKDKIAIEIRFDSDIPAAIDFAAISKKIPDWKVALALTDDVKVAHDLVEYCIDNGLCLLKVHKGFIATIHDPETPSFIKTKLKFPLTRAEIERFPEYADQLRDAKEIFEIGKDREAVGVVARVLEQSIGDFLEACYAKKKLPFPKEEVFSKDFDGRITFLRHPILRGKKKKAFIDDRELANFMSVKWDRNVADHPKKKEEVEAMKKMAAEKVKIGYLCIEKMVGLRASLN